MTIFIRLTADPQKEDRLRQVLSCVRAGLADNHVFSVELNSLRQIPGAPFAYWVSERVHHAFRSTPAWSKVGRSAHQGLATADNFRFVRAWWEVRSGDPSWKEVAKGATRLPFYGELALLMNWGDDGAEMKAWANSLYDNSHWSRIMMNAPLYFRRGITYARRPHQRGKFQFLPPGAIFSTDSPLIITETEEIDCAILNSSTYISLLNVLMARGTAGGQTLKYETGYVSSVPLPIVDAVTATKLCELSKAGYSAARALESQSETSRLFCLPRQLLSRVGRKEPTTATLEVVLRKIDETCQQLYHLDPRDFGPSTSLPDTATTGGSGESEEVDADDNEELGADTAVIDCGDTVSWIIGVAFGRWDVRLATGQRKLESEPGPFDPLPVCSPGMLTDQSGLPAKRPPEGYRIAWPEDGILVDDPGMGGVAADRDIVRRARQVIEVVWGEKTSDIEHELCELLGVQELRDYLRKPSLLFDAHLKRYSKSRRKAPIYWPLSTASGSYTVWVYYPRLTADTLYKIIAEHVGPKIGKVEDRIAQLEGEQAKLEGRDAARAAKELGELTELLAELKEMREELLRVAKLPYKPDLNDGVQITAAPLWPLFRLPRWRAELEKTWKALECGDYDWAQLAYAIWPDRVKEKCKTDKSLAIAHGLEKLHDEPEGDRAKAEVRESKVKRTGKRQKRAARGKR